ncbi:MAG: alpha-2-macroglobulin family protein, partial [Pseudomonadota bacterium]
KGEVTRRDAFVGALSARIIESAPNALALADARAASLDFLDAQLLADARNLALYMGRDTAGVNFGTRTLQANVNPFRGNRNDAPELRNLFSTVAQTDAYLDWQRLAARAIQNHSRFAIRAAINAYLRAERPSDAASALVNLARAFERAGQGRESIPALRLSQSLAPRPATEQALTRAIGLFGFRITDSRVENNAATPRVCLTFSEALRDKGFDYATYLRLPAGDYAAEAAGRDLCITGAAHGSTLAFTLRQGLPAQSGEVLAASIEQ